MARLVQRWATHIAAVACVALVYRFPLSDSTYTNGLLAQVLSTSVIYAFQFARATAACTWCVLPIALAVGCMATAASAQSARGWCALAALLAWCARYNYCLPWVGWTFGLSREDWRYGELAKVTGVGSPLYWLLSFTSLHQTPALLVWFTLAPAHHVLSTGGAAAPLGRLDALALGVVVLAIAMQAAADETLHLFRRRAYGRRRISTPPPARSRCGAAPDKRPRRTTTARPCRHLPWPPPALLARLTTPTRAPPPQICREGLWAYSRHPNYAGECLFWAGIALVGLAVEEGEHAPRPLLARWGGALAMLAFFRVLACLMDARLRANRCPGHEAVMRETSALVTLPRFRWPWT